MKKKSFFESSSCFFPSIARGKKKEDASVFGSFDENEVNSNSKKKAETSSPISFSSSQGERGRGDEDSTKGQEEER